METDPDSYYLLLSLIKVPPLLLIPFLEVISAMSFVAFLLLCSALISGSEVAYFSLTSNDFENLRHEKNKRAEQILNLKEKPRKLLATILITNNFINIAIVIVSDYILRQLLPETMLQAWADSILKILHLQGIFTVSTVASAINFVLTVVGVTFLLVLFGEVIPKIYARINKIKLAKAVALPLTLLSKLFQPISYLLVRGTNLIENKLSQTNQAYSVASKKDFDNAIDLTVSNGKYAKEEVELLKSIVNFGEVSVKQIMKSRVDVVAIDMQTTFSEVLKIIKDSGYSRIPVYKESFDHIIGILYAKDLITHINKPKDFDWQQFVRKETLFAPEQKKISELLKDFKSSRLHMAIVVDEFGGSSGIVTLEDIMEEVIGDIRDEFDDKSEIEYKKIDDHNYIFEGKSLLNDVCRVIGLPKDTFDEDKGESDSLAGLILELLGYIPQKGREIFYKKFKFKIISSNPRRIEEVQITLPK